MLVKRFVNRFLIVAILFVTAACGGDDDNGGGGNNGGGGGGSQQTVADAAANANQLWASSPSNVTTQRMEALNTIQKYANQCTAAYFSDYLGSLDQTCENMEQNDLMLHYYRYAFDRVLEGIKTETPEQGSAHIWMLYNMGYVVKTPTGCFGVDIAHRWAVNLTPYLDFLCVTHNHADHYNTPLIQAMLAAGKPVLSNYVANSGVYKSTTPTRYVIGEFTIKTGITDHNTSNTNFITTFHIDCAEASGNLRLMHVGDCNYNKSKYETGLEVDVFIPRYAPNALTENNVIGQVVFPKYTLLSHILELTHVDESDSRWSISSAFTRAGQLNCVNTWVPFWGEKLIWKNETLSSPTN